MKLRKYFNPLTWFTCLCYFFLYIPLCVLTVFSFNDSRFSVVWKGFTWDWYVKLIQDPQIMDCLYNSVIIALAAAILVIATKGQLGCEER